MLDVVLIDLALLGIFATQHTVLARPACKRWWTPIVPAAAERSPYVLVASPLLLLHVGLSDMKSRRLPPEWLIDRLSAYAPDVVGVSALNCEAQVAKRIAEIVEARDLNIVTALGGLYAQRPSPRCTSLSRVSTRAAHSCP